jgi:hypothetical protein
MTHRELEEYRALRDTIRQRGTTRIWVFLAGMSAWATLTVATAALAALPVATLLPLLVLAAAFEAVFSLHVGVERIGRYVQVFFEDDALEGAEPGEVRKWEHAAMTFGRPLTGTAIDPLFATFFILAAALNFVPVLFAEPVRIEIVVVGAVHLLLIGRILAAKWVASRQRAADLDRFRQMQHGPG